MRKVAIYARVSTRIHQDFQHQINALKTLIHAKGYKETDIDTYAESISGYKKNDERPQLEALIKKTESNPKYYDCIYTAEISRIGRKPSHTRQIIDRWTDIGQQVHIPSIGNVLDENGKQSMLTSIILQILIEYANLEAETFKIRSRSGLLDSAKHGGAGGGIYLPYGYVNIDKKLVVEPKEAVVIKKIFKLYKNGNGIKVISNVLNEAETPTRTNTAFKGKNKVINFNINKNADSIRWSDKQIHDILKNTIYKGERRFKGEIIKLESSIITPELFDECTAIRLGKTHRNYLTTYTYLLKDILFCGCCGRKYFAKYKPVEGGDKVYICSSRLIRKGNCGNIGVNITLIESAIYDQLVNTDAILKYLNNTKSIKVELESDINRLTQKMQSEENALISIGRKEQRLLELRLDDAIKLVDYKEKKAVLEADAALINERLAIVKADLIQKKAALAKQDYKKATKKMLLKAKDNRKELQAIYRQLIDKVILNKLDTNSMLATIYISVNGVVLLQTLKVLLDLQGMRKKPMVYQYYSRSKMENNPSFIKNVLMVDIDDIKGEIFNLLEYNKWNTIPNKHLLTV